MEKEKNRIKKSIRVISISVMLMALSVVIGIVCKNLFTWGVYYRVTFENFPVIMAGYCFGPIIGVAVGVGADAISCLLSTNPVVNPIISAGAAAVGLLSGLIPLILRKAVPKMKPAPLLAAGLIPAHLIGQVLIKSIGKIVYYGMPKYGIFIGLGISLGVGTAEFFIIRLMFRNRAIAGILGDLTDHELY